MLDSRRCVFWELELSEERVQLIECSVPWRAISASLGVGERMAGYSVSRRSNVLFGETANFR